jgi:aspartyl-tRNA synthetase
LTEFTGLDLEMAIEEHYHEALEVIDQLLRFIFTELKARYSREIDVVRQQFPSKDFTFPEKTVILTYRDGLKMLQEDGVELEQDADINTENEKRLGRLVKAKFGTDYYIMDKFPIALRPFYTMPDASDPVSPASIGTIARTRY